MANYPYHERIHTLLHDSRAVLAFLWHRMVNLRLPQVAGSLSYTTVLSMVPLLVIVLSVLTILPQFAVIQKEIQAFMTENLMPAKTSKIVMQQITTFAERSSGLSLVGGVFLVISSLSTMAIIDRAFDDIWQVKRRGSIRRNVTIYWSVLTLGPFVFSSFLLLVNALLHQLTALPVLSATLGWILPFLIAAGSFAALYVFVPNRRVLWQDAWIGGIAAALIFTLLTKSFAAVFKSLSSYAVMYGAFTIVPAFFLWLYVFWLGILFGAGIAANLPILKYERGRAERRVGHHLFEAMQVLDVLHNAQQSAERMTTWEQLQEALKINHEELGLIMEKLQHMRWVGKIKHSDDSGYWGVICDLDTVTLGQLYDVFAFDGGHFAEQAERLSYPWAVSLSQLNDTRIHHLSMKSVLSASTYS